MTRSEIRRSKVDSNIVIAGLDPAIHADA